MSNRDLAAFNEGRDRAQPTARQTHGIHSWADSRTCVACARCIAKAECEEYEPDGRCGPQARFYQATVDSILRQDGLDVGNPVHVQLAREFAFWATLAALADRWTADVGWFRHRPKDIVAISILKARTTASNRLQSIGAELGLSPGAAGRVRKEARVILLSEVEDG